MDAEETKSLMENTNQTNGIETHKQLNIDAISEQPKSVSFSEDLKFTALNLRQKRNNNEKPT